MPEMIDQEGNRTVKDSLTVDQARLLKANRIGWFIMGCIIGSTATMALIGAMIQ